MNHRLPTLLRVAGWPASALILASVAVAQGTPAGAELQLRGAGPYYTLTVPLALRSAAASPGLDDLQVRNSRGDLLPMAWVAELPPDSEEHASRAAIFKMPGAASGPKTLPPQGWMLDVRSAKGALLKLDVSLAPQAQGLYTLSVEASDDLQQWQLVQPAVQVLSLQHQGQQLRSTSIELGYIRAAYLRLKPLPGSALPELASAQVSSVSEHTAAQPLQWTEPIAPAQCAPTYCDYPLPRHLPLELLELQLAEPNTLGRVQLLGRVDPQAEPQRGRPHGLRQRVHALRHKSAPPDATQPYWAPLASAEVYRLALPQGEARSGAMWLDHGLYPQLRVQTEGPIAQLGAKPPLLRVGAHARALVFLAREPAPYRLTWGQVPAKPIAISLEQLIPTRQPSDRLPADSATVVAPAATAAAPVPAAAPAASAPGATAAASSKPWLWAALLGGVALMGFMAWSLLRGDKTESNAGL